MLEQGVAPSVLGAAGDLSSLKGEIRQTGTGEAGRSRRLSLAGHQPNLQAQNAIGGYETLVENLIRGGDGPGAGRTAPNTYSHLIEESMDAAVSRAESLFQGLKDGKIVRLPKGAQQA